MINKRTMIVSIQLTMSLCLIIFSPLLSQAADVTLTVGNGSGIPGSSDKQVEISLENLNDKVRGIQVEVCDVDNYLSCMGCEEAERASGFLCSTSELTDGCCRVVLLDMGGGTIEVGEGVICTLTYYASEGAPLGECRDLNPEDVKISDEFGDPFPSSDIISEPGEFCFVGSLTIVPDSLWKSHWIPLPCLIVIEGEGTNFKFLRTKLEFDPPKTVFPLWPLVLRETNIWDIIWVMPSWLAGGENQEVTLTVTTEEEVVKGDFEIRLLPFILDQQRSVR